MGFHSYKENTVFIVVFQILTASALFKICLAKGFNAAFVFGDSLADAGNNNYMDTLARYNVVPNGIDFGKPTGRFTNGKTIVDLVGQQFGFKGFIPPYLDPATKGQQLLNGVNYASGGSGILNGTGEIFVGRINLDTQISNFEKNKQSIISIIGQPAATQLIGEALFSITVGSNDFLNNYLVPLVSIAKQVLVSPEIFVTSLITRYRLQLTRLYNLGARKIVVTNVGPIGCIPYQRDVNPTAGDDCVDSSNKLAQLFNAQLKTLIAELSTNLRGSKFVYADVYNIVEDILNNYKKLGFENANSACCFIAGRFGGLVPCGPLSTYCPNRSKYVFWDGYHPSEATNILVAKRLLDGDTNDISPINLRQLAEI